MNNTRKFGFCLQSAQSGMRELASRFLLAVIVTLVASLVGCGMKSTTTNHPGGLTIATNGLQGGTVGVSYQQVLAASGGTAPYTWSLVSSSGQLPAGLNLSATGMISGVPSAAGTADFSVLVSDSAGSSSEGSFSIAITNASNPGISVSKNSLSFTTSGAQTFNVSGGDGTVTEIDDCNGAGIASVTAPGGGSLGTWTVTPESNGGCSISFQDKSGASANVSVSVSLQTSGTSTLTFQMEESDDCGGVAIYYRFFDETDNLVWPAPPNAYYFPYSDTVYTSPLSCQTGAKICYGGSFYTNTEAPQYWGVGINNDESCANCCFTCQDGTTPTIELSCSAQAAERRIPSNAIGPKVPMRPAPIGRAPAFDPAKDTLR